MSRNAKQQCRSGSFPLLLFCLVLFISVSLPGFSLAGEQPREGDTLPPLSLVAPALEKDKQYLGLNSPGVFNIQDVDHDVLLLELVGVYCPYCHKQAPLFNSLFKRFSRARLGDRIKMLAVASGATEPEVAQLRKHSDYAYPVLRDEDFSLHKALGEPKTPFTLVIDKKGTILFAKMGVIESIDELYELMRSALE